MGMFDEVNYSMICPICGHKIDDFQTKDCSNTLSIVEISDIPNNGRFYSSCHKCGLWVEFEKHRCRTTLETEKLLKEMLSDNS